MANIIEKIDPNSMETDDVIFDSDPDKAQKSGERKFGSLCIGVYYRKVNIPSRQYRDRAAYDRNDWHYEDHWREGYSPVLRSYRLPSEFVELAEKIINKSKS